MTPCTWYCPMCLATEPHAVGVGKRSTTWPVRLQALLLAVLVFAAAVQACALLVLCKPEQARALLCCACLVDPPRL